MLDWLEFDENGDIIDTENISCVHDTYGCPNVSWTQICDSIAEYQHSNIWD